LGKLFTHVPLFTNQYNLVPVKGWWCSAAGLVAWLMGCLHDPANL